MQDNQESVFGWCQPGLVEPGDTEVEEIPTDPEESVFVPQTSSVDMALRYDRPFVANNPITETFCQAVMHTGSPIGTMTGGWSIDGDQLVFSPFRVNGSVRISLPNTDKNRHFLESPNTLPDSYALCLAALSWSRRNGRPVVISNNEILNAVGFSKYGLDRNNKAELISNELKQLSLFDLEYSKLIGRVQLKKGKGKKQQQGKGVVSFRGDRLFNLVRMDFQTDNHTHAFWNITPGQWAYYYLNPEEFDWVTKFPRVVFELDWRPQRPAEYFGKKLAYSLVGFSGGTTTAKGPFKRNVSNLLCAIGELPLPEHRDNKWASRTRDRMERGLLRLVDMNVLSHIDYSEVRQTNSNRYWAKSWLNSNLSLQLHTSLQTKTYTKRSNKNVKKK